MYCLFCPCAVIFQPLTFFVLCSLGGASDDQDAAVQYDLGAVVKVQLDDGDQDSDWDDDPDWEDVEATLDDCLASSSDAAAAQDHEGPQKFQCPKCGERYRSVRCFEGHTAVCGKASGSRASAEEDEDEDEGAPSWPGRGNKQSQRHLNKAKPAKKVAPAPTSNRRIGLGNHKCHLCLKTVGTMEQLEVHVLAHYGYPCARCNTVYPDIAQLESLAEHNKHVCPADSD